MNKYPKYIHIYLALLLLQTTSILAMNGQINLDGMDLTDILGALARNVVEKYLLKLKNNLCLSIVTEDNSDILNYMGSLDIPVYHVNVPHRILYSKRLNTDFEEYVWEESIMHSINAPCLAYVIQTSELNWMVRSFARMYHTPKAVQRFNRTFLYLPVVSRLLSESEFEDQVKETFRLREMDFMPDLAIVKITKEMLNSLKTENRLEPEMHANMQDLNIETITHEYVSFTPWGRKSLDMWNMKNGFLHGKNLYPNKMSNLMGKKIFLTTIVYDPLTIIDWEKDPSTYDGIEPQFIFQMAKHLNFTYGWIHDDQWWGQIFKNGSGNGIFGSVSSDRAEVGFNAMYLWEPEHHYLDYSTVHYKSSIKMVCPKPKKLPGWMTPILPFSTVMWYAVVLSVVMCTTLLYITSLASARYLAKDGAKMANMYSSWVECLFRTSGLLVLQVPPDERDWSTPRYVPMRHLVTWIILFYFVVTTAYGGGLATVLTVPRYEKPIDGPKEMAERNTKWTAMYDAFLMSMKDTGDPTFDIIVKNWRFGDEEWLASKTTTGDYCFVLEEMLGGHFCIPSFITIESMDYLRIAKEELYCGLCVYSTRKGSPLMPVLNRMLGLTRDAGLFFYWENMIVRNYLSTRLQLSVINSRIQEDDGPTKLQMHHIQGAFFMMSYGLFVSFVVFIIELVTYRLLSHGLK